MTFLDLFEFFSIGLSSLLRFGGGALARALSLFSDENRYAFSFSISLNTLRDSDDDGVDDACAVFFPRRRASS